MLLLAVHLVATAPAYAEDSALGLLQSIAIESVTEAHLSQLQRVDIQRRQSEYEHLPEGPLKTPDWPTMSDISTTADWTWPELRALTSGERAMRAMADHLTLPHPKWLGDSNYKNMPLKLRATPGKWFQVDTAASELLIDQGTVGNGNGVVDVGEWVQLGIAIRPKGKTPMFSTSAWVESGDPCVFVNDGGEEVLGEFGVDPSPKLVHAWVYISNDCKDGDNVGLWVKVMDTKLGSETDRLPVHLQLGRRPQVSISAVHLESDVPGFSDNAGGGRLEPTRRYEISLDINATASPITKGRFVVPKNGLGLTEVIGTDIISKMIPESDGRFRPTDDLDIAVAGPANVRAWLNQMDRPWTRSNPRYVAFAVDVLSQEEADPPKSNTDIIAQAISVYQKQLEDDYRQGDLVKIVEALNGIAEFEQLAKTALSHPDRESSKAIIELVDRLAAQSVEAEFRRAAYWTRRAYPLPIGKKTPVVIADEPAPLLTLTPHKFMLGFGMMVTDLAQDMDPRSPGGTYTKSLISPSLRVIAGDRLKFVFDASLDNSNLNDHASYDASAGARYALLHTGRFELGPYVAPGIRYTVGVGEWTIAGFIHGGIFGEFYVHQNFGFWAQAGGQSPAPPDVGRTYRYGTTNGRLSLGVQAGF